MTRQWMACVIVLAAGCGGPSPSDAGPDGSAPDGSSPCVAPAPTGQMGGRCSGGTMCETPLDCYEEVLNMGAPFTLGDAFDIPEGTADPAHPGEYIAGSPSSVVVVAAPGGQCTRACDSALTANTCGECAACSTTLGGSPAFPAIGISIAVFDYSGLISDPNDGICRQRCVYDPATNGGCPSGYTCDVSENLCVEACVNSAQCNVGWGVSEAEGLVAYLNPAAPYTCNTSTGRCSWTPAADGVVGRACDSNAQCPADRGFCFGGRCTTWECNLDGGMAYPCPATHFCLSGFSANPDNPGSLCAQNCTAPADCFSGQACRTDVITSGAGVCWWNCTADAECQTGQACQLGLFRDPAVGLCYDVCDPANPTAVCAADEVCLLNNSPGAPGTNYFCAAQNNLCAGNAACTGAQACLVTGDNLFGRCVAGCARAEDCAVAAMEECVIHDDMDPTTPPLTRGVCRAPGGVCSPSPTLSDGTIRQSMRGDPQCIASQRCSATEPDTLGTCIDRM